MELIKRGATYAEIKEAALSLINRKQDKYYHGKKIEGLYREYAPMQEQEIGVVNFMNFIDVDI